MAFCYSKISFGFLRVYFKNLKYSSRKPKDRFSSLLMLARRNALLKDEAKGETMNTLNSAAHLQREIGDEAFKALISSDNTNIVRQFAQSLVKRALPIEITVGGRTYELLKPLREGEMPIGSIMLERVKKINANLGQDDGEHILKHQNEIPINLRNKVIFLFPDWLHPDNPKKAAYVAWEIVQWVQKWHLIGHDYWCGNVRLLRPKQAASSLCL